MSCLFDSLSYFTDYDSYKLRQLLVRYISSDPIVIDDGTHVSSAIQWEYGQTLQEYVNEMKKPSCWGDHICISAFVNLLKMRVIIHCNYTHQTFENKPLDGKYLTTIHLRYYGNHYTPLICSRCQKRHVQSTRVPK